MIFNKIIPSFTHLILLSLLQQDDELQQQQQKLPVSQAMFERFFEVSLIGFFLRANCL
jgi:hypothetical protein